MIPIALHRYALSMSVTCALLAGCGGSQPPIGTSGALPQIASSSSDGYRVLHNFTFRHDGRTPKAGLTYMDGMLYGTTYGGGHYQLGTVFRISTSGKENVVHTFGGVYTNDGENPAAGLLAVKHSLYGTTEYGAETKYSDDGCVFSLNTSGTEQILYRFRGLKLSGFRG